MYKNGRVNIHNKDLPKSRKVSLSFVAVLALFALLVAVKLPTIRLPYHWDEMGAYVTPALNLANGGLKNVLVGFRPSPAFYGHPPLLYVSLALVYEIFGFSTIVSHSYVLFWSFLGLFYTYRLGHLLFNPTIGILASLFLLFTPLYFSQSGLVLGEIPITAAGVMAVYYAVRGRMLPCLICSTIAVLMKETAVAIPIAITVYACLFQRDHYGSRWKLLLFGLPVAVLGIFYFWQKAVTGDWVSNPYFGEHPMGSLDIGHIISNGIWVASFTCLHQYRVLWFLLILLCFLIAGKKAWKQEYVLFILIGTFFIGAFSIIYFAQRYILAVLPYLAIMSAGGLACILEKRLHQVIVGVFIVIMSISVLHEHQYGYGNFDYDMQYTDIVSINQQCCRYLEENYPEARIAAPWPVRLYLSRPWQGYVEHPLKIVDQRAGCDFVIVIGLAQNAAVSKGIVLEKRFEKNNKILRLYRRKEFTPVDVPN